MNNDVKAAFIGDHEAARRVTEKGELLPCPWCGGQAEYIERGNEHIGLKETAVRCKKCGAKQTHKWRRYKFDFDFVRNRTRTAWNTRVAAEICDTKGDLQNDNSADDKN